jgi:iron complex transport system substrate-binding protein
MMSFSNTTVVRALAAVAAAAMLAGCGSSAAETPAPPATRDVQTDFGTVTLPTDPQAALGMYTTDIDMLITLGIPLAASQPIRGGYTTYPAFFPQEELAGVTTFENYPEYNFEKILEANPDLILNGLGYDADVVKRLPEIAPTFSVDMFDGTDWREKFVTIAQGLDRVPQQQAWTAAYDARVAEVKERLAAEGVSPVVASAGYWEGKVSVDCYGVPCLVFRDLGLTISPLADGEGTQLSSEQIDQLAGVEMAFMSVGEGAEGQAQLDADLAELGKNELWAGLPFVAENAIHRYDMEMVYGSPSGQLAFLDEVERALLGSTGSP